jgi:tRNA pseudouridine55 synthase
LISSYSGLVLLNKPSGITSFKVLNSLKKTLNTGKIGHTGTLDKFAEGLMLVLTGKMTKLAPFFSNLDKEYIATYKFGEETNTLDPEGSIIFSADVPDFKTIEQHISNFTGNIMQTPPDFSAIHVNGQRAYKLALDGKETKLKERPVTIYLYKMLNWEPPYLKVKIKCSKGTYVRSLARDLGLATGSRAHVSTLRRTEVGSWNIENSICPKQFVPERDIIQGIDLFKNINNISTAFVDDTKAKMILNGLPITQWIDKDTDFLNESTAFFDEQGLFLALITNLNNRLVYRFVQDRSK